jgi:apolipoprotein N-acyltransferase
VPGAAVELSLRATAPGHPATAPPADVRRVLAAAVAGGALYFLGHVGFGLWPLLLVFQVPLWRALDAARGSRGRYLVAIAGAAFGLTAFAGGFEWLWQLFPIFLGRNAMLGAMLWLGYGAWFALGWVVYALLFAALRARGAGTALAGIAPLVLVEWLQPQIFTVHAGAGLIGAPLLAQGADLGGPLLLSAVVAAANVAAGATWGWLHGERVAPAAAWTVAALVGAATCAYGAWRTAEVSARAASAPALTVGIVQANLGVLEKRTQGIVGHRRHLEQTRELLAGGPVDLVVWPETAYVRGIRRPLPVSGKLVADEIGVPLLFGGTSVDERDGRGVKSNSSFLVGADGTIADAYDKNLLIPLAEYVPFGTHVPALGALLPHVQDFAAATDTPALRLGAHRLATPICYEAIRPEFVRRMVRASGADLIVTLANDAWFGDSQEPWMHLALARLRAIEHRRWLVRATNSGISALVDPTGAVVARTGVLERANLRGTVRAMDGTTVYARFGDWPGWLALVAVAGTLLLRAPAARTETGSPPAGP